MKIKNEKILKATIKCQQKISDASYIQIAFTSESITGLTNSTILSIPFTIKSGGTSAPIVCTGTVDTFTPQSYNGIQLASLNINPSPNRYLKVASYPTISFTQNQASTSSLTVSPYQASSFQLFLR